MGLISYKRGQGSIVLRIKILNSSVSTGAGLTGLTSGSASLLISTIADNESSATAYSGSNLETITTLGTYAAPTSGKARFKEVDATNHKGVYEIQLADARYAVSSAKSLLVSVSGATNAAETDVVIPLTDIDPYDTVRAGLTAMPNVASGSAGALITAGTGTAQLNVSGGRGDADVIRISGSQATADNLEAVYAGPVFLADSVQSVASASVFDGSSSLSSTDDFYNKCALAFTSGANKGVTRKILDYTGSTRTLTMDEAFVTAPSGSDTFIIIGRIA